MTAEDREGVVGTLDDARPVSSDTEILSNGSEMLKKTLSESLADVICR